MNKLPERMQNRLYHDLILPEKVLQIREKARYFAERYIFPESYKIGHQQEAKENFPEEIFQELAKHDFFKIPFSKEEGGLGLEFSTCSTCVAIEEIAYVSDSVASWFDVHCILAGHALCYGSDYIKKKYLKPMISGQKKGCFATTEPKASSDLSVNALNTKAKVSGDKYIVNGQKRFITNACVADHVVALVNIENKLSMLVIELDTNGCKVGPPDIKLGNKGQLTSDIYFKDVVVPKENLVSEEGKGLHIALGTLTYGRVGIAASGVGMAQSAFDESVAYMKKREAFGKKLFQFQYWQFKLAERAIEIENARNLYSKAALRMDKGVEFPEPEAAGAKYYGTKVASDLARDAVQIFGGYGFLQKLMHDQSNY
ncbi:MAG: acyl-CoA dehydrogenase, partial [Candidatus Lokiarchaeota archaeon]|nr:acyl-CoA dehydrogenase [Candidatus Lokiarchaeota archaeon]